VGWERAKFIAVYDETKKKLEKLKVHPGEPYDDVVKSLIEKCGNPS